MNTSRSSRVVRAGLAASALVATGCLSELVVPPGAIGRSSREGVAAERDSGVPDGAVGDAGVRDSAVSDARGGGAGGDFVTGCAAIAPTLPRPSSSDTSPRELVFVLAWMNIDMTDDPTVCVRGFNVDGIASDGARPADCSKQDSTSSIDPDQNCAAAGPSCTPCVPGAACAGGVDNQAPVIANTIDTIASPGPGGVRGSIADAVNSGRVAVLMRVAGVNGVPGTAFDDPDVEVQIARAVPAFTSGCGSVQPDRPYSLVRSSLRPGGTSLRDALFSVRGRINRGRLETVAMHDAAFALDATIASGPSGSPAAAALLATLGGGTTRAPIRRAQLRATLTADGRAVAGNFGGFVRGDDMASVALEDPMYGTQLVGVLGGLIDVQLEGVCANSMPFRFGGLGLGYGTEWVRASVAEGAAAVVDSAPRGVCGASP